MITEALAVTLSISALAVCVAYCLRHHTAMRVEYELCDALARAKGRCDKLAADLAAAPTRLNQANQALALAEDEIALLNSQRKEAPAP